MFDSHLHSFISLSVRNLIVAPSLPPSLAHALSSQEHPLYAGAGFDEEQGVPADVSQHEVLCKQVDRFPPGGPHRLLLVRLQRCLDHHQVAHFPGDGEDQEGVEHHWEVVTEPLHPAKHFATNTRHISCPVTSPRCLNHGSRCTELTGRTGLTDTP